MVRWAFLLFLAVFGFFLLVGCFGFNDNSEGLEQKIGPDLDNVEAYINRGIAYANSGDFERAIADFEQYLDLVPDAPDREEVLSWIDQMKSELAP